MTRCHKSKRGTQKNIKNQSNYEIKWRFRIINDIDDESNNLEDYILYFLKENYCRY